MIKCLPQEDELITSHISRLAHINGLGFDKFITLLTTSVHENKRKVGQSLEIHRRTSVLVGLSPHDYLMRHTMLPIDRFAANTDSQVHNFEIPTPHRERDTLLLLNQLLFFCPSCAADELRCIGYSTWKRIHQIKGVDWCLTHGEPLHHIHGSEARLLQPHMVDLAESAPPKRNEFWSNHSSVIKYSNFCRSILNEPSRFHRQDIARSILHNYVEKGLTSKPGSPGRRLSDLVKEQYPISWLEAYYPSLAAKLPEQHSATIDSIVGSVHRIPGESYALTLSALFNNYHDALAHIKSPLMKSRHSTLSISSMTSLWVKHRGNMSSIVKAVNESNAGVSTKFRSAGFPSPYRASCEELEAVLDFLRSSPQEVIESWLSFNKAIFKSLGRNTVASITLASPLPLQRSSNRKPGRL